MNRRRTLGVAALVAVLALGIFNSAVWATTPTGQHASGLVTGTLSAATQVNTDRIKFQTKGPVDVAMFTVTYDAGGFSGWHTHPGVLFVLVVSGAVVRTVGCESVTYSAGQTFVESDEQPSGEVRNASATEPAVLEVAQIVPKDSGRRVEGDPPSC